VSSCGRKIHKPWGGDTFITVPIMSLWRHRQELSNGMIVNFFITLAQIALIFSAVLLWFFG